MAIRAFYPRENQLTEAQMRAVRLDALEHRIEAFPALIDAIFARHKEELISEVKRLMEKQMEAIMSKLANVEDFDFSVERTSSQAAVEVIVETTELKVRSMSSNVPHTLVTTTHDSLCPDSNEVRSGVFEEILPTGGKLSEIINQTNDNVKYLPGIKLNKNVVADQLGINCCVLMGANITNEIAVDKFSGPMVGYRNTKEMADKWAQLFNTSSFMVLAVQELDELRDIPTIDIGDKISSINRSIEALGEGKLRSKLLAKLSPYIYLVEKRMAKVQRDDFIKQPEQLLPPPEPPPPEPPPC